MVTTAATITVARAFMVNIACVSTYSCLRADAERGHGLVDLAYDWQDMATGERGPSLSVVEGRSLLAAPAEAAKAAYDQHLRSIYDAMLSTNGDDITKLLGAA